MREISRNRTLSRVALCVFLGVALIVAGGAAVHAQDDDDGALPDVKFVRKMLRGFGLRNGQEAGIEYKERPPLVVPPNRDLPPPVSSDSLAVKSAAWPSDPDEKRRAADRKEKSAKRDRKTYDPAYNAELAGEDRLMPDQLAAKSDKPSERTSDPNKPVEMTPSELGFSNGMWKTMMGLGKTFTGAKDVETSTFKREPSRNALTDPPAGYRTPSPVQPYGINTKQDKPKLTVGDRQTEGTGYDKQ
jgi:hypothetical protein